MKNEKDLKKEIIPMNEKLYEEFYVEELEQRLETDPFLTGGFLGGMPGNDIAPMDCFCSPICELGCVIY